jgi:hypothetical protein
MGWLIGSRVRVSTTAGMQERNRVSDIRNTWIYVALFPRNLSDVIKYAIGSMIKIIMPSLWPAVGCPNLMMGNAVRQVITVKRIYSFPLPFLGLIFPSRSKAYNAAKIARILIAV